MTEQRITNVILLDKLRKIGKGRLKLNITAKDRLAAETYAIKRIEEFMDTIKRGAIVTLNISEDARSNLTSSVFVDDDP